MCRLFNEPPDPLNSSILRFLAQDERVAGDEHAQAEGHELHSGGCCRNLARYQIKQAARFLVRKPENYLNIIISQRFNILISSKTIDCTPFMISDSGS